MTISQPLETKRETLDIRTKVKERRLLDQAVISLNEHAYIEFLDRLSMPPRLNARLQKTMQAPAPWDEA